MEESKEIPHIDIEMTDEIAEGIYANLAMLGYTPQEFIFDFVRHMPGQPKARIKARIVVTPDHAKRFAKALLETVKKYELQYGQINDRQPVMPMNFGPTAQA
jgi:hypothetical protein